MQSAVLLRDAEIQAQFADYYYDYTAPSMKMEPISLSETERKETKKDVEPQADQQTIGPADVHVAAT